MNAVVGPMISRRAYIGWTTTGHTGEDLTLYSYGPGKITGTVDNTDIAKKIAEAMGLSLDNLNASLFVPARKAFESAGATVTWDVSDAANPVVVVQKGTTTMKLQVSTNTAVLNNTEMHLGGLTVLAKDTTFVPQQAVDLFIEASN